jgi:hypothetical protein
MNKNIKSNNRKKFVKGGELNSDFAELPQVDADDSIESMFKNEQYATQDNVKELFHEDKVKARTDISARQIKLITKAFYLAEITGMKEINAILRDFLVLSISKDRKSRLEYVEGLKAKIDDALRNQGNVRGQFGR